MYKHIAILYVISFVALSIAMGAAFGQRSDYLRLKAIHAPMNTVMQLFRGHTTTEFRCPLLAASMTEFDKSQRHFSVQSKQ